MKHLKNIIKKYFSKNILKGFGAVTYLNGIGSLVPIISVPVFLKVIGANSYGEWILINSIAFYFSYSDLGLNRILANSMTIDIASGNVKEALLNFHKSLTFIFIISTLIILGTILILALHLQLFNSKYLGHVNINYIFFFILLNYITTLNLSYLEAVYRSSNDFTFGTYIISTIRLISQLSLLITLLISKNILLSSFFMASASLLGYLVTIYFLKKRCAWFIYKTKIPDKIFFNRFFKPSITYLFYQIGESINMQGINIIVGTILSPFILTVFATTRTLVNSGKQFINMISYTYWPEYSREFGKKDYLKSKKLVNQAFRINIYGTILLTTILLLFGKEIYLVWTNNKIVFDNIFFTLLLIDLLFYPLWNNNFYFLIATNKHSSSSIYFLIFAIIQLIISVFYIKVFSITLIPIITIIIGFIFSIIVYKKIAIVFQEKTLFFIKYQFKKLLLKTANT